MKDTESLTRHRYNVWIDVPTKSGDGWNKYPDYSAEEIGRALRRALHAALEFEAVVEHADSEQVAE
jgi:hypothetical protein